MVSMGPPFLSLFSTSTMTYIMDLLLEKSMGYLVTYEALTRAKARIRATIAFISFMLIY